MKHRRRTHQSLKDPALEFRMERDKELPLNGDLKLETTSSGHLRRHRRKLRSAPEEYEAVGQHIAIVGGGVAGLAAAARLAALGYRVDLLEAASEPGGKMRDFQANGFRFDGGPSLFTLPEVMEQLFADCGKRLSDYVTYDRLELVTRYFYPDGTQVNA